MAKLPSIQTLLRESWAAFTQNFGPLFAAGLMLFFVSQLGITLPFMGPFCLGLAKMSLDAMRGRKVVFDDFFDSFKGCGPSLLAGFLLFAAALLGLICASVVFSFGFYAALMSGSIAQLYIGLAAAGAFLVPVCAGMVLYTPAFFFLADHKMTCREALRASERLVRANWGAWSALWGALGLLHLVSTLACCLPSLVVTPWMAVALAAMYEQTAPQRASSITDQSSRAPSPVTPENGNT